MENTEEKQEDSGPAFALGWLIAPLAILLSFATSQTLGLEFMTADAGMTYGALCAAAILATVPRYISTAGLFEMRSSVLSLAFLAVSLVIAWILASFTSVGALTALLFLLLAIGGHLFDIRGRHEEQTVLTFVIIGFVFALFIAGAADVWAGEEQDLVNNTYDDVTDGTPGADGQNEFYLNEHRQATGFLFFSAWTVSALIGVLVATAQRGVLFAPGTGKWWSFLPKRDGYKPNSSEWTLMAVFGTWALAHLVGLIHFATGDVATKLELTIQDVVHGHISYWWSAFTGIVLLFIGFCIAERWFTRAMLVAVSWIMYTIGGWQEAGWMEIEMLEGTQGLFIWLGISFFVFVGVFYIAGHDKWGGWDNRSLAEPSNARQWWQAHWAGVLTMAAFIVALVVRTTWNVIPAMAATGTLGWDMTGGSDPWYMKRAVDYIIAQHAHFIFDADRAYPIGGINPRPPLFAWSLALGGMITAPFLGMQASEAVWWSVAGLPALYGALTVFPLAALARDQIGKGAGVITAWLIALMPGHVGHSTFALADHDAFVLLFLSLGFHYYLKAVQHGGNERLVKQISWRPKHIFAAMSSVVSHKRTAVGYAILAGMAISTVALGWKGFVYGPAIIFAAFVVQIVLNLIRRRDSTILATLNIIMLSVVFLVPMPFYAHPQLNLVWDASGFQPMFYIFGFTLLSSFIVMAYRDKPWLLVFGTGVAMITAVLSILAVLQFVFNIYNGWDVLFTGGYYFTKNKIFGTIAEAQAPSRGTLFASFGPLVFIAALSAGVWGVWQGIRHRRQTRLVLGLWVLIGAYMAWSAGRFIFNASPAMAVLASWAIVGVWQGSGATNFTKEWRKLGVRTPGERFTATRKALWRTPAFSALGLVMLMLMSQHATYGLDSGIPRGSDAKDDVDSTIYYLSPDMFRFDIWDFSLLDNTPYQEGSSWYMNSFGPGFNGWGWNTAYDWLASQDLTLDADNKQDCDDLEGIWRDGVCAQRFGDRPAFVSWWDYGFQALAQGQHPSVSDNFQSGIPATGNMLLSRSQDDLVSLFIWQLTQGDLVYSSSSGDGYELTSEFSKVVKKHLNSSQVNEFIYIQSEMDSAGAEKRAFSVVETNGQLVLAKGGILVDGVLDESAGTVWRIYDGVDIDPCDDESVNTCIGDSYASEEQARLRFSQKTVNDDNTVSETTYYIIGEYWYTTDLVEEFDSVSSNLHRKNARLAMTRQLLTDALDTKELNSMYSELMSLDIYDVQDSEGAPGETFRRNHEIRYFAVDNRLYPIGGRYDQDRSYNYGNPTGIFHAPTTLGGQDVDTFLKTTYETERDGIEEEMTAERYEEAYVQDLLNQQQQGSDYAPLNLVDIRVDHKSAFFDTMLARAYVGYGASTLGLDVGSSNPQPAQHFQTRGSPGSMLQSSPPLPGAMLNHFVIANWYGSGMSDEADFPEEFAERRSIAYANTQVKVLKYYAGTEICGTVEMSDDGKGMNNTRVLLERDAFSGEDEMDMDNNSYWIPIAAVDADENGDYCVTAPAGHLRLSAYLGDFSSVNDEDLIRKGEWQEKSNDLTTDSNEDRDTNAITAILGGVSNMTWLNEVHLNVTGEQGHSGDAYPEDVNLLVDTSGVSGVVTWSGNDFFEDDPLVNTDFILRNIWSSEDNYTLTTTNGSFNTSETRIVGPGQGEVTFTESGTFVPSFGDDSTTTIVRNFRGNYTRTIDSGLTYTGDGKWTGKGLLRAYATDLENNSVDACAGTSNESAAYAQTGWEICLFETGATGELNTYLFNGSINASGRMTANGSVIFTTYLDGETFEGVGSFEGTGTINGTGTFTGIGHFSGPIVEPGSFYISGLTPGTYNMIAQLDNGKEVLLPQPVEVKIDPQFDLRLTMPGSLFTDTMEDMNGETFANRTFELIDIVLGEDEAIVIETNETGGFKYGPLSKGEYYYRFDLDNDGWYELNNTLFVGDESEELSVNMPIPIHSDVSFKLSADSLDENGQSITWNVSNRTMIVESKFGDFPPFEVSSDEDGNVRFESPMGHWIVSDMSNETHMLWFDFELKNEDLDLADQTYIVAVNVSGQVVAPDDWNAWNANRSMEHNFISISGVNVTMRSGNLVRYDVTDENGVFTARLPAGAEFSMTTVSPQKVSTASRKVTIDGAGDYSWDIDNNTFGTNFVNLTMEPSDMRTGQLNIYDNETLWDDLIPGWQAAEIIATNNESGVSWSTQTTSSGDFEFFLPYGNYTVQVLNEDLNIDENYFDLLEEGGDLGWTMQGSPALTTIDLQVFLDDLGDGLFENGTPVSVDITLKPVTSHGDSVNISVDNGLWAAGVFPLEIEAGEYEVIINSQNISNESARLQYQTKKSCDVPGSTDTCLNLAVPLSEVEDPFMIALEPEWLLTAQVMNGSSGLDNASLTFYSINGTDFFDVETNETGDVAAYIPVGEWHVVLHQIQRGDYYLEMQENVTISLGSERSDLIWNTVSSTNVSIHLSEEDTNVNLSGYTITAVSKDGLRNVSIGPTDTGGTATGTLTTGDWTFYLNKSTTVDRWVIEEDKYTLSIDLSDAAGQENLTMQAKKTTLIGGKIFWDLDGNGIQNSDEGIQDVLVEIVSENMSIDLITDSDGVWEVFAPILTTYTITVSKEGFSSSSYEGGFIVNETHVSEDLALTAGNVSISGNVSHLLDDLSVLENTTITLYPVTGRDLESVVANVVLNGSVIEWDADVTPGNWVVWAELIGASEDDYSVAMGLLKANVSDGGTLDLEMRNGGWVSVQGKWKDFQIQEHHIGESSVSNAPMNGSAVVELDLDDGLKFELPTSNDGSYSLLLPTGRATFSVSFSTNEMGMEMNYSGGVSIDVITGVTQEQKTITAARSAKHDVSFEIISVVSGATNVDLDDKTMVAIEVAGDGDEPGSYQDIIVEAKVTYSGNQAESLFTLSGDAGILHDSPDWNVTFLVNSSNEEWNASHSITLGLGENLSAPGVKEQTFRFKIQLPTQDLARSYDDNHSIGVEFKVGSILTGELGLEVHVPQKHEVRLDSIPDNAQVGVAPGGETPIDIEMTNLGNGEDTVQFELDASSLPDDWSATPTSASLVMSATQSRTQSFTIHAPLDADDGTYVVKIIALDESGSQFVDENGDAIEEIEISVSIARANIEIIEMSYEGEALFQDKNTFNVKVSNTGTLDAGQVDVSIVVSGELQEQFVDEPAPTATTTISVPAGETVSATIELDLSTARLQQIKLIAYATTTVQSVDGGDSDNFEIIRDVVAPTPDEPNTWLPIIIIGIILIGIYAGVKGMAARRGPKF